MKRDQILNATDRIGCVVHITTQERKKNPQAKVTGVFVGANGAIDYFVDYTDYGKMGRGVFPLSSLEFVDQSLCGRQEAPREQDTAAQIPLKKRTLADVMDCIIQCRLEDELGDAPPSCTEFSDLVSMGTLVDSLAIVNIKLYNLKNEVMRNQTASPGSPGVSETWYKHAAVYDVQLCEERSRIKACIDKKLSILIHGGAAPIEEFKSYK